MKSAFTILQVLVRLLFFALLVLGVIFWTGHALGLIPVHMLLGVTLALALMVTSILGAAARVPIVLTILGVIWGAVVVLFGMKQMLLLPGPTHWLVQVAHLLIGMAAIGLNERIAMMAKGHLAT